MFHSQSSCPSENDIHGISDCDDMCGQKNGSMPSSHIICLTRFACVLSAQMTLRPSPSGCQKFHDCMLK